MKISYKYIIILLSFFGSYNAHGQKDIQPPLAPVLKLVSVNPENGYVNLIWTLSPSHDVAGYVIYSYKNGEGYAFDTIWDPSSTSFTNSGSASSYFSESYVISAIDSSGNLSPLSNGLNTIFSFSVIDTCSKNIEINWNNYQDYPNHVSGYKIMASVNGNSFIEIADIDHSVNRYNFTDFETDAQYCFVVNADLGGSLISSSNKTCIDTKMQRPPEWINADYATVTDNGEINLSFSYENQSGIFNFLLEKKTGLGGNFTTVSNVHSHSNPINYTDEVEDLSQIYYYRLSAINNCNSLVLSSNLACNISLDLEVLENEIRLNWNKYREWNGNILTYKIYSNTKGAFEEMTGNQTTDTTYSISYSDIMYNISEKQFCFYIKAQESSNPYLINGESVSSVVCSDILEIIKVPNAFTPNNDLINDGFKPVLSFTPKDYHLMIRDRNGYVVFETRNHLIEWDGKKDGKLLPSDVYLWFLNVNAPSGKAYSRTGTITIIEK
jgi:gliding motility-associated-like protein